MNNPYINNEQNTISNEINETINDITEKIPFIPKNFDYANFLKGLLLGAGLTYLMTNEKASQTLFKAIAKGGNLLQTGIEEMKERFEDAKAEINSQQ